MRLLVVGTGVIGTTYGWQISLAGHDVAHWVRDDARRAHLRAREIRTRCLDLRGSRPRKASTLYRPPLVGGLDERTVDLIVVSVNSHQLRGLMPDLERAAQDAAILFLQNTRPEDDHLIVCRLPAERVVIGYPFRAGGGRDRTGIDCVIFGNVLTHTMVGCPHAAQDHLAHRTVHPNALRVGGRVNGRLPQGGFVRGVPVVSDPARGLPGDA